MIHPPQEQTAFEMIAAECIECGLCLAECGFLRGQGLPKMVAERTRSQETAYEAAAFSCSLCGLCAKVCPRHLPIPEMFLNLRQQGVARGRGRFSKHHPLRVYEWLGKSPFFRAAYLPADCRTVFFPGCALPGVLPQQLLAAVNMLRSAIPHLGVVLDCCNKPSHDLGDRINFLRGFSNLANLLERQKIEHVIFGCPSCFQIFNRYSKSVACSMLYGHLAEWTGNRRKDESPGDENWTIHDPCSMRSCGHSHQEIRRCTAGLGLTVTEMEHHGATTFCCGEGGAALMYDPRLCSDWKGLRIAESQGKRLVTWCAGCTIRLRDAGAYHLLELIFADGALRKGRRPRLAKPPFTYFNRLLFKRQLRRMYAADIVSF